MRCAVHGHYFSPYVSFPCFGGLFYGCCCTTYLHTNTHTPTTATTYSLSNMCIRFKFLAKTSTSTDSHEHHIITQTQDDMKITRFRHIHLPTLLLQGSHLSLYTNSKELSQHALEVGHKIVPNCSTLSSHPFVSSK